MARFTQVILMVKDPRQCLNVFTKSPGNVQVYLHENDQNLTEGAVQ